MRRDDHHDRGWLLTSASWGVAVGTAAGVALAVAGLVLVTCGVQIGVFYRAVSWAAGDCD